MKKNLKTQQEIYRILLNNIDDNLDPLPTGVVYELDPVAPHYAVVVDEVYYRIHLDNNPLNLLDEPVNVIEFVQDDNSLLEHIIDWDMIEEEIDL